MPLAHTNIDISILLEERFMNQVKIYMSYSSTWSVLLEMVNASIGRLLSKHTLFHFLTVPQKI
jgi:hypothetical protein